MRRTLHGRGSGPVIPEIIVGFRLDDDGLLINRAKARGAPARRVLPGPGPVQPSSAQFGQRDGATGRGRPLDRLDDAHGAQTILGAVDRGDLAPCDGAEMFQLPDIGVAVRVRQRGAMAGTLRFRPYWSI